MNCIHAVLKVCASVRATGRKNAGALAASAIRSASISDAVVAERLLERGANSD